MDNIIELNSNQNYPKRKILITGSNGMLAKAIIKKFKDDNLILTDRNSMDISDHNKVMEVLNHYQPDYVINCAAYTKVDDAEDNIDEAIKVNEFGPRNLAFFCSKINSTLIHISTDYVFDGDKDVNDSYSETDGTNPRTAYGLTKSYGEKRIIDHCSKYYIFRTAWLFGSGNNFVRTMIKLGKEQDEVTVVNDQYGSPTYTEDLAGIIHKAIKKQIPYGIYNATNSGYTSWFEFAEMIFEKVKLSSRIVPVSSEEFVRRALRPKNLKLCGTKLKETGINVPSYEDALCRYLKKEGMI